MLKTPEKISNFNYKREEGTNPYTGFMSFQHFRGEKLYSDIVVKPENKYTETERVECYPVSSDAEENGREEGWYPDSSIVYIRILWKEFEPERGVYNYAFIEKILSDARAHNQTLIFRLMAHSTRACDDVPEWLKTLADCPERPPMKRVKDSPTDPLFLDLFLEAVKALGARFDSDPVFDSIDISLPGSWGEGHKLELYPEGTLERIVDTYVDAFPNTQLLGQASRPALIKRASKYHPAGWRGDGFGSPKHIYEMYPVWVKEIEDVWKTAPVSFEAYWWIGEWERQGWDIDDIIETSLGWHLSSFNAKSIAFPEKYKDKINDWIARMGYHYNIAEFAYPASASAGDELLFKLTVDNVGVAPIYKKLPLTVKLLGEREYVFTTDADIRTFMPGTTATELKIALPADITPGSYKICIGIISEIAGPVTFATDAERIGDHYNVGELTVK